MLLDAQGYSFFHSSTWAKSLSETYKFEPLYFAVFSDKRFAALVPFMDITSILTGKRGVSLPFTDFCEPIFEEGTRFREFFDFIINYGRGRDWKFIEIRGAKHFFQEEIPYISYYTHNLNLLSDEDHLFASFSDSTRRNIRKANQSSVTLGIRTSMDSMKIFYRLHALTRKYHGLPPQPFIFFQKIYEYIILKQMGFVATASINNKVIAASVFFIFGEKAIFKYGASDRKYLQFRPNNLLFWETIKWLKQNGYKDLSFGRTDIENQGLRKFKLAFGTEEETINYYRYNIEETRFTKNQQESTGYANRLLKKMPTPLLQIIGSLFYRHMG